MDAEELRLRCAHGEALMMEAQARRALYAYLNKDRLNYAQHVVADPKSTWWQKRSAAAIIREIEMKS